MLKIIALTITTAVLAAFRTVHAQTQKTSAAPTDPQIAMIAVTADTVDIDVGKLAAEKDNQSKSEGIRRTDGSRSHLGEQSGDRARQEAQRHT